DMIISGGYNVYPREVEDALLTHTAVDEAVVVGTPDDQWVEAVTAVVVLADGVTGDDALRTELISHVAARLASYKKPRSIVFRDAIAQTAIEKLDRKQLRVTLAEDSCALLAAANAPGEPPGEKVVRKSFPACGQPLFPGLGELFSAHIGT